MATATTNNTSRTRATAGKKAAATRKRNAAKRSQSAKKAAATRAEAERTYVEALAIQAERAVLIPVGAALVARDTVVETVVDTAKGLRTRAGVERELKRFERRGNTARNRAVREVKRTRTRSSASCASAARRPRASSSAIAVRSSSRSSARAATSSATSTTSSADAEKLVDRVQEQVTSLA